MPPRLLRFALGCLPAVLAAPTIVGQTGAPEITIDHDDVVITEDTRVKPDTYRVQDLNGNGVVIIRGDGLTVDFQGATLAGAPEGQAPDRFSGLGIRIQKGSGVTLRNVVVRGFKVGVAAYDQHGLRIEGAVASGNFRQRLKSTPEREDGADWLWPHRNDRLEWTRNYGAGIALVRCREATVTRCSGHHGQNGLLLCFSTGCQVFDNDFSFNSGWGLAMWRSSKNVISHNKFDWCVRGYSHHVYARGQDSAGILVFEQCSDNVFALNSATHGGDGFFLYAGDETTRRTGEGGSNRNLLYRNDFSHAVANGIEATFSDGNRFLQNVLRDCNYGVWAGYSTHTVIAGNRLEDNSVAGIAIEHGSHTRIEGNTFQGNTRGIQLWWDRDQGLVEGVYGRKRNTASEDYTIVLNRFTRDATGIELRDTRRVRIESNRFTAVPRVLHLLGKADPDVVLAGNNILRGGGELRCVVWNETRRRQTVGRNYYDLADDALAALVNDPRHGPVEMEEPLEAALALDFNQPLPGEEPPEVPGRLDAFLPPGARRGRRTIMIDEWGPFDFQTVKLFPREVTAWNEATLHLVGPEVPFTVEGSSPGVRVEPRQGRVPARLRVTLAGGGPCLRKFAFRVRVPGHDPLTAAGVLIRVEWNVKFFTWKRARGEKPKDPPGGARPTEVKRAWKRILGRRPLLARTFARLDFTWAGRGPTPEVRDFFATVATARIELPAGAYRFTTVSDDGIRVRVDGRVVIEDWTWHPPRGHETVVRLGSGIHRIRVEHFEIDGYAQLQLRVKPEEAAR